MKRSQLTSAIDLLGLLLILAAIVWAIWILVFPPAALAAGGLGLLGIGWLVDRNGGQAT